MLKNKKLVKIAVCMLLSVTLVCATFLEVFAEDVVNYVPYTDTENNMYYHAEITANVDKNDGIVYAVQTSTLVAKNVEEFSAAYDEVIIETTIQVFDGGEEIHSDYEYDILYVEEYEYGLDVRTDWIVPNVANPFDYVITYHVVRDPDIIADYDDEGNPIYAVIWDYTGVYGYNDLLLFN